jgi:nucleotide-binding universal stress UspA family protein
MYRKMLIPLDGSELAECSLEHAKAIAQGCNVPDVILFQVIEPFSMSAMPALSEADADTVARVREQNRQETKEYLSKVEGQLRAQGIATRAVSAEGRPADEILGYAEKNDIDLIIMSTHGRSGLSRFFFGSVAEKVYRYSPVPVLLLSPKGCQRVAA